MCFRLLIRLLLVLLWELLKWLYHLSCACCAACEECCSKKPDPGDVEPIPDVTGTGPEGPVTTHEPVASSQYPALSPVTTMAPSPVLQGSINSNPEQVIPPDDMLSPYTVPSTMTYPKSNQDTTVPPPMSSPSGPYLEIAHAPRASNLALASLEVITEGPQKHSATMPQPGTGFDRQSPPYEEMKTMNPHMPPKKEPYNPYRP